MLSCVLAGGTRAWFPRCLELFRAFTLLSHLVSVSRCTCPGMLLASCCPASPESPHCPRWSPCDLPGSSLTSRLRRGWAGHGPWRMTLSLSASSALVPCSWAGVDEDRSWGGATPGASAPEPRASPHSHHPTGRGVWKCEDGFAGAHVFVLLRHSR